MKLLTRIWRKLFLILCVNQKNLDDDTYSAAYYLDGGIKTGSMGEIEFAYHDSLENPIVVRWEEYQSTRAGESKEKICSFTYLSEKINMVQEISISRNGLNQNYEVGQAIEIKSWGLLDCPSLVFPLKLEKDQNKHIYTLAIDYKSPMVEIFGNYQSESRIYRLHFDLSQRIGSFQYRFYCDNRG